MDLWPIIGSCPKAYYKPRHEKCYCKTIDYWNSLQANSNWLSRRR